MKHEGGQEKATIPTHTLPQRLEALAGHRSIPLLLALSFLGLNSIGLDRSPAPFQDNAVISCAAYQLAFHRRFAALCTEGTAYLGSHFFLYPPGFFVVLALVYKLLGFGIWQTRLVSLAFGALALVLLYLCTRRLTGSALAGLAASLLLWGDPNWIYESRTGRMDTMAMALALGALLAFLHARAHGRPRWPLVGIAGLLGGLAIMTGPRSAFPVLGIGLALLATPEFGHLKARLQLGTLFAAGVALPGLGWLPYILSAPQAFQAQFIPHTAGNSLFSPGPGLSLHGILGGLWPSGLTILGGLAFACSPYSLRTRYRWTVLLLLLATFPLLAGLAIVRFPVPRALAYIVPVFAVPAGGLVAYLVRRWASRPLLASFLLAGVVGASLVAPLTRLALVIDQWESRSPQDIKRALAPYLEPPCTVAGEARFYYAAVDLGCVYRLSDFGAGFPPEELAVAREEYRQALAQWGPRYLILDQGTPLEQVLPQEAASRYQPVGMVTFGKPPFRLLQRLGEGARPIVATVYRRGSE